MTTVNASLTPTDPLTQQPLVDAETLAKVGKRAVILAAIILPAIVLTMLLVISEKRTFRISDLARKAIPATIMKGGVWTSTDMKFSDEEMQILETKDYVYRTYTDGKGAGVDLCVVFSEDNRKGTHPPDVCLEGSGLRLVSREDRTVDVGGSQVTVRELVASAGSSNQFQYFAYFYKCGDVFTPSFYKQQMQIVWNGLTRQNASGALIRYSMPMEGVAGIDAARKRTDQLLAVTFPYIRDGLSIKQ